MADLRDEDFRHFVCVESGAVRAAVAGGNGLEVGEGEVSHVFVQLLQERRGVAARTSPPRRSDDDATAAAAAAAAPDLPSPAVSFFFPAGDTASHFPFNSKPNRKPPRVQGGGVGDQSAMLLSS